MMHDWPPRRRPPSPRYRWVTGALLALLVSGLWLMLYAIEETRKMTPEVLLLAMMVGAPVLAWQYRAFIDRRQP